MTDPGHFLSHMYVRRFNSFKRSGNRIDRSDASPGDRVPGYCVCGRPSGRSGRCETCEHDDRRSDRRRADRDRKMSAPRKRIPRLSKKRAALEARYSVESKEWLVGKKCAVYPHLDATEVHHKKGRRGYASTEKRRLGIPLLLDKDHWLATSHDGHTKITNESAWAERMGFTEKRSN